MMKKTNILILLLGICIIPSLAQKSKGGSQSQIDTVKAIPNYIRQKAQSIKNSSKGLLKQSGSAKSDLSQLKRNQSSDSLFSDKRAKSMLKTINKPMFVVINDFIPLIINDSVQTFGISFNCLIKKVISIEYSHSSNVYMELYVVDGEIGRRLIRTIILPFGVRRKFTINMNREYVGGSLDLVFKKVGEGSLSLFSINN